MIRQLLRARRRRILIDINTQKDFFLAGGNACIGNHRRVLANVRRIMAWARYRHIPIISTCEVYPAKNAAVSQTEAKCFTSDGVCANHNGLSAVSYCISGTEGQKKIRYTLVNNQATFPADGSTDLPVDLLRLHRQIILQKRCVDPFDEPRIDRLLSEVRANEFVLIGASTEGAVKATALGLLQRGKRVSVVYDAVGSHNKGEAELALRKMKAKGARLIETKRIAGSSHLRLVGICDCERCQRRVEKKPTKVAAKY